MADDIAQVETLMTPAQVQQVVDASLAAQKAHFDQERQQFQQQIDILQRSLLQLKKQVFGRKSEKYHVVSSNQQALFEQISEPLLEEVESVEIAAHKRKRKKRTFADISDLPRERVEYYPEQCDCEHCGDALQKFGEDIEEEIEFIPSRYLIREHVKVKMSCPSCKQGVVTGELPSGVRIIDRCKYGAGLLSKILVSKYADGLPLYRQVEIFAREGLQVTRATLSRHVLTLAELLSPVAEALRQDILSHESIHADETKLKRQTSEKEGLKEGYLWGVLGPPGVYFRYDDSRAASRVKLLLGERYKGYVHCDHYAGYQPQHLPEGALRVACWAHTRRKFIEATTIATKQRDAVLKRIATIYKEEKRIKKLPDGKRLQRRQEKLAPLFKELRDYLVKVSEGLLKSDGFSEAAAYALRQWESLTRILEHPLLALDTNAIERQMRSIAVGRKNFLFAGSEGGAAATAVLYSLVNTCRIHKINPQVYLADVLRRLETTDQSQVVDLTPLRWLQLREQERSS